MIRSRGPSVEQQTIIARTFFYSGWACLPLMWLVSVFFFQDKLRAGELPTETQKWVMLSLGAAGLSTAFCIIWVVLFQTSWRSWEWSTEVMVSVPDSDMTGW